MSTINEYGFSTSDDGPNEIGITVNTPFLDSSESGIINNSSSTSGKIGSGNNNNNNNNRGIGSGGGINNNSNNINNGGDNFGFGIVGETNNNFSNGTIAFVKGLTHPIAASFHVLFKVSSILLYLFSDLFGGNFIMTFILCMILLSFDFWTVKNVTGRLLVGLRWWNQVSDDGSNKWHFETAPQGHRNNQIESLIFWISLLLAPLFWLLFFLKCIISFQFAWILIPIVALSLSFANIIGYYKCSNSNVSSFATSYIGKTLMARAFRS